MFDFIHTSDDSHNTPFNWELYRKAPDRVLVRGVRAARPVPKVSANRPFFPFASCGFLIASCGLMWESPCQPLCQGCQ